MTIHPICPKCGGFIPNNDEPGKHFGAISRVDNATEICNNCGTAEAIVDWLQASDQNRF